MPDRLAVIDTSVALKWIVEEEGSDKSRSLRDRLTNEGTYFTAPDFLLVELNNVIWKKITSGQLTPDAPLIDRSPDFGLDFNWVSSTHLLPRALKAAVDWKISVYDGLYVSLADRLDAPLYTADELLLQKFRTSNIKVVGI